MKYLRTTCLTTAAALALPLVASARDLTKKGFGYKNLAYDIRPDYARPKFYNDMFKKWGLDTGVEWIPGKR